MGKLLMGAGKFKAIVSAVLILLTIFLVNYCLDCDDQTFNKFPLKDNLKKPIHILYFFFGTDCDTCVQTVKYLNELNKTYKVTGIVFEGELDSKKIREYGIEFEVRKIRDYEKDFVPWVVPSVMGVFNSGTVFFIQPGFPDKEVTERLILESVILLDKAEGGKNA